MILILVADDDALLKILPEVIPKPDKGPVFNEGGTMGRLECTKSLAYKLFSVSVIPGGTNLLVAGVKSDDYQVFRVRFGNDHMGK